MFLTTESKGGKRVTFLIEVLGDPEKVIKTKDQKSWIDALRFGTKGTHGDDLFDSTYHGDYGYDDPNVFLNGAAVFGPDGTSGLVNGYGSDSVDIVRPFVKEAVKSGYDVELKRVDTSVSYEFETELEGRAFILASMIDRSDIPRDTIPEIVEMVMDRHITETEFGTLVAWITGSYPELFKVVDYKNFPEDSMRYKFLEANADFLGLRRRAIKRGPFNSHGHTLYRYKARRYRHRYQMGENQLVQRMPVWDEIRRGIVFLSNRARKKHGLKTEDEIIDYILLAQARYVRRFMRYGATTKLDAVRMLRRFFMFGIKPLIVLTDGMSMSEKREFIRKLYRFRKPKTLVQNHDEIFDMLKETRYFDALVEMHTGSLMKTCGVNEKDARGFIVSRYAGDNKTKKRKAGMQPKPEIHVDRVGYDMVSTAEAKGRDVAVSSGMTRFKVEDRFTKRVMSSKWVRLTEKMIYGIVTGADTSEFYKIVPELFSKLMKGEMMKYPRRAWKIAMEMRKDDPDFYYYRPYVVIIRDALRAWKYELVKDLANTRYEFVNGCGKYRDINSEPEDITAMRLIGDAEHLIESVIMAAGGGRYTKQTARMIEYYRKNVTPDDFRPVMSALLDFYESEDVVPSIPEEDDFLIGDDAEVNNFISYQMDREEGKIEKSEHLDYELVFGNVMAYLGRPLAVILRKVCEATGNRKKFIDLITGEYERSKRNGEIRFVKHDFADFVNDLEGGIMDGIQGA